MSIFDIIFGKAIDRRISAYQNDLITKHCDEVQNMYTKMRSWRHDYHNHIQAILALCDDPEKTREYLWKLYEDLSTVDTVYKTGNVMVDAILNSKLSLISEHRIKVNVKASVPADLKMSDIDICVIIGNLLDNAMEACLKIQDEDERFIRIFIGVLKSQLYISVSNSCPEVKKLGKKYLSTKNSESHGFGIMRIDRIAEKYNGFINRQNEEKVFATEVMLPL